MMQVRKFDSHGPKVFFCVRSTFSKQNKKIFKVFLISVSLANKLVNASKKKPRNSELTSPLFLSSILPRTY